MESPFPAFVRIDYNSSYGVHSMQLPTRAWTAPTSGELLGTVPRWSDDTQIDLLEMIEAYLAEIVDFFPATVSFNVATVFTEDEETGLAVPQISTVLEATVGTAVTPGWTKAVQQTISVRDTAAWLCKYVFLDCASFNSFDPVHNLSEGAAFTNIMLVLNDPLNAFSSQKGNRPQTFIGAFKTLNEKLRKAYRMN